MVYFTYLSGWSYPPQGQLNRAQSQLKRAKVNGSKDDGSKGQYVHNAKNKPAQWIQGSTDPRVDGSKGR